MGSAAYYNDTDPYVAQMLRNLIAEGLIANGIVDERSITEVQPNDLRGFTQCHFFAGIGGWSLALRMAMWPDDKPVWTGSCPCQPFSAAGKQRGFDDDRHLWPHLYRLIKVCRPPTVIGEQVASPDALEWLDVVQTDLENTGYAVGSADLCAAGIDYPHIRQRLYWVADDDDTGLERRRRVSERADQRFARQGGMASGLADSNQQRIHGGGDSGTGRRVEHSERCGVGAERASPIHIRGLPADWLLCRDGKWRPVEPGTFPLAHGISGRVGRLRAYGNAIVPALAAEFITAYMEAISA